jgi:hypothetical protein
MNQADRGDGHAELLCQRDTTFALCSAFPNRHYFGIPQFGPRTAAAVPLNAVGLAISRVLFSGAPTKIFEPIVSSDVIQVPRFMPERARTGECQQDKAVNQESVPSTEVDLEMRLKREWP